MKRMNKELNDLKEEVSTKDNKLKQLKFENDKLYNECNTLRSSHNASYSE